MYTGQTAPARSPTILQRTPYDKTAALAAQMMDPLKAAKAGFALIIQDTRRQIHVGRRILLLR